MGNLSEREQFFSKLAVLIGGWNASFGTNMGRLREWDQHFNGNDRDLMLYMLESHKVDVTFELKNEIKDLKAKLYDLTNKN